MFGLVPFDFKNNTPMSAERGMRSMFDLLSEPFFNDIFAPSAMDSASFKVDVKEKEGGYELSADLPGMKKEDIHLSYENSYLTISAEQKGETEETGDNHQYIRRERHYGSMSRSFHIDGIDEGKVTAEFKDGVLKVELPKKAAPEQVVKEIPIQ